MYYKFMLTKGLKAVSIFLIFLSLVQAKKKDRSNFDLRPAIGGEQSGWFDAEGLPTAIKINNEWVLPRSGTMEWLMSKGYVPDTKDKSIMKPNPFDKRYKKPGPKYLPSLATTPLDYIYVPKPKKSNDPFAGLAEPMKRKFSKVQDNVDTKNQPPGPVLEPDLPDLKDSPFAEPSLPNKENQKHDPFQPNSKPGLPPNDPFVDSIENPTNNPDFDTNKLPGKSVIIPKTEPL
jgi:hypothetical protein